MSVVISANVLAAARHKRDEKKKSPALSPTLQERIARNLCLSAPKPPAPPIHVHGDYRHLLDNGVLLDYEQDVFPPPAVPPPTDE